MVKYCVISDITGNLNLFFIQISDVSLVNYFEFDTIADLSFLGVMCDDVHHLTSYYVNILPAVRSMLWQYY